MHYLQYLWRFIVFSLFIFFTGNLSAKAIPNSNLGERNPPSKPCEIAGMLVAKSPDSNEKLILPLKKTDVYLDITSGILIAQVTQQFKNETDVPLEAIYVFPLPSKAAVTDMKLIVGDRVIKSVVKERAEARKTFEKAKKQGKRTALLEQERPNIFTTSIANFLPGESAKISFSYMEAIDFQKGSYSVNFPMVVGQRYIPFNIKKNGDCSINIHPVVPDADRINPPLLHPHIDPEHRLSLIAEISGIPVDKIISNTHGIIVEDINDSSLQKRVTLSQSVTIPDCDFNMKLHLKENRSPQISFLHTKRGNDSYGMLTVFPPTQEEEQKVENINRDVIFLIDTSGSMSGESISQAKAGLKHCLGMLRSQDHFTIIRFADSYSFFSPTLRPADPHTLETAKGYIDGLSAGGGTEMQKALEYVLSVPGNPEAMKMIVFLTDGDVGNESSLMRLLDRRLENSRMFTFGIGSAPNEYLMRKMAEIGRGQSRFIRSHEDIGLVMADFFKTLETPILTDISIKWNDFSGKEIKTISHYPDPCPDVFHARPLQIFMKFPTGFSGNMVLSGMLEGEEVRYVYPVEQNGSRIYPAIDKMFGRAIINDQMVEYIRSHSEEEKQKIKAGVIDTALTHQLVSKFTSRVAVEEKIVVRPDQMLATISVPVSLPRGWNPAAFFPTATNHPLQAILGTISIIMGIVCLWYSYFLKKREDYA